MTTINTTRGTVNPYYENPDRLGLGYQFFCKEQQFLIVTDEQGVSFEKAVRHQGKDNYQGAYYNHLDNYLGVQFKGIFIGIETDGYAHS